MDGTIASVDIKSAEVKTSDIADSAVTTAKIGSGQVTNSDIATSAVTSGKISDTAGVQSVDILDGSVKTQDIADGTITSTDIAPGTIPSGGSGTLQVTSRSANIDIPIDSRGGVTADCLNDEVVTGGGFSASVEDGEVAVLSSRNSGSNGWSVFVSVPANLHEDVTVTAIAECAKLVP